MNSNVHVAGGSDAPVEHPSPFIGLHDAIFRSNGRKAGITETTKTVFRPEECLTFAEALWIYTVEGAYTAGYEQLLGRIAKNYIADLVLVDPLCAEKHELLFDLKPDAVIVGGNIVARNNTNQEHAPIIIKGVTGVTDLTENEHSYNQKVNSDGPYVPGKGGDFSQTQKRRRIIPKNCQIVGFCNCFLNKEFCF